jgi:hypothetical protein
MTDLYRVFIPSPDQISEVLSAIPQIKKTEIGRSFQILFDEISGDSRINSIRLGEVNLLAERQTRLFKQALLYASQSMFNGKHARAFRNAFVLAELDAPAHIFPEIEEIRAVAPHTPVYDIKVRWRATYKSPETIIA